MFFKRKKKIEYNGLSAFPVTQELPESSDLSGNERLYELAGYISADLAHRADTWDGNVPAWFPEPTEFVEMVDRFLEKVPHDA